MWANRERTARHLSGAFLKIAELEGKISALEARLRIMTGEASWRGDEGVFVVDVLKELMEELGYELIYQPKKYSLRKKEE